MAALGDTDATIVPFSPAEPQMASSGGVGLARVRCRLARRGGEGQRHEPDRQELNRAYCWLSAVARLMLPSLSRITARHPGSRDVEPGSHVIAIAMKATDVSRRYGHECVRPAICAGSASRRLFAV